MGTLSSLLGLAQQALQADQFALNVTANNVANQNVVGYTRQVVNWSENDSVRIGSYDVGQGASISQASQRDRVLEKRVQQQTQAQTQSAALESALGQIQNIFGLSSNGSSASTTQLGSALNNFYGALSSLVSNPADSAARQKVISTAQSLVGAFNSASNQMSGVESDLNKQVSGDVDGVNGLLSTIATLNKTIASLSPDADAGTLEDQRQQAITQLSQYIGLDQITNENNQITLTTTNGALLVSGSTSYAISTTNVLGKTNVVAGNPPKDITDGLTGGDLGGTLEARDKTLPQYQDALDQLAFQFADQFNQANEQGLDASGGTGQAIFTLPSTANRAASQIAMATTDPNAIAAAATDEGASGASKCPETRRSWDQRNHLRGDSVGLSDRPDGKDRNRHGGCLL